jgi:drug/metabolite transporter (DMT)-like permease
MKPTTRDLLLLHFIVFVWGWTAVLGKIITLPALQLIWLRVIIAFIGMLCYVMYRKTPLIPSGKTILQLLGIGLIVGIHWICFYRAVKVSNVAVTLACFSTGTLFTSLLSPLINKRKILWYEIFFGLVVIGALLLIFRVETQYKLGILLGVGAALTSSIMAILNSIMSRKNIDAGLISTYEMVGAWVCISLFLFRLEPATATFSGISSQDWMYLVTLSILCTTVPFIIGVAILKNISPYTMTLTLNLETIYGILFAFFIFTSSEKMSGTFYIGAAIILATIVADTVMKRYTK